MSREIEISDLKKATFSKLAESSGKDVIPVKLYDSEMKFYWGKFQRKTLVFLKNFGIFESRKK